jgi:hypothetical protein
MRYLLIILFVLAGKPVLAQCIEEEGDVFDYRLTGISIEGSTNVSRFSFLYNNIPIEPQYSELQSDMEANGLADFKIPLMLFEGSVPAMKDDFLKLLKAEKYPEVVVAIERNRFHCNTADVRGEKNINLIVILAGVKRAVPANFRSHLDRDNNLILTGNTKFLLSDFNLDPPQKALGLIQVRNEVLIKFDIVIEDLVNKGVQATK